MEGSALYAPGPGGSTDGTGHPRFGSPIVEASRAAPIRARADSRAGIRTEAHFRNSPTGRFASASRPSRRTASAASRDASVALSGEAPSGMSPSGMMMPSEKVPSGRMPSRRMPARKGPCRALAARGAVRRRDVRHGRVHHVAHHLLSKERLLRVGAMHRRLLRRGSALHRAVHRSLDHVVHQILSKERLLRLRAVHLLRRRVRGRAHDRLERARHNAVHHLLPLERNFTRGGRGRSRARRLGRARSRLGRGRGIDRRFWMRHPSSGAKEPFAWSTREAVFPEDIPQQSTISSRNGSEQAKRARREVCCVCERGN